MAIDHASYFIARVHPAEMWAYPPPYYATPLAFFTRWITHLCAPGFFLLMGAGMYWFAASRAEAGWSRARIARYFVTRGLVLLFIQHFVENPAWAVGTLSAAAGRAPNPPIPGGSGDLYLPFAVITALGASMIFWSGLTSARTVVVAALTAAALGASLLLTPGPADAASSSSVLMRLLFVAGRSGFVQVMYPIVPWLVPAGAGLLLARALSRPNARPALLCAATGLVLLAVFGVFRNAGVGDPHAAQPGVIGFLTVTKYPPSLAFFAVTLGIDLLLLAALSLPAAAHLQALAAFGRAPLFFYLLHLYVFAAVSWLFREGTTFSVMYVVWAAVVLAMYPACRRYAAFKAKRPLTSWWRLL
jgi:uncharacterized membrane protein